MFFYFVIKVKNILYRTNVTIRSCIIKNDNFFKIKNIVMLKNTIIYHLYCKLMQMYILVDSDSGYLQAQINSKEMLMWVLQEMCHGNKIAMQIISMFSMQLLLHILILLISVQM